MFHLYRFLLRATAGSAFPPRSSLSSPCILRGWRYATLASASVQQVTAARRLYQSLDRDVERNEEDEKLEGNSSGSSGSPLVRVLREAEPLSKTEDIQKLFSSAKNEKEVNHALTVALRHHLSNDLLNGHGYRVSVMQALTAAAPRTGCLHAWFTAAHRYRQLGFVITRTFAAEGFTTLRHWLIRQFDLRGRSPHLATEGISHMRELLQWCREDRLVMDHVLYTRVILLLTMVVSFFDRQNLYRSSFTDSFVKRDGVVVEWVVSTERCTDFDEIVLLCDAAMEEVLELMYEDTKTRPSFSVMYRLIDYYFATDNLEKMIAVMEDGESFGIPTAESSTAKLMQLACAMNCPDVPKLLMRWRVELPQCVLSTTDMSRLLFYYGRSGGGHPCPHCGEKYNHRHASVYVWLETPPHQRNCPALRMARSQRSELEEDASLPQNRDWSQVAMDLLHFSEQRSITWGSVEWRGFLLCHRHAPTQAAQEAIRIVDELFPAEQMDDFLRATYMRCLRHHQPTRAGAALRSWSSREQRQRLSPMVLQEALMAVAFVVGSSEDECLQRYDDLLYIWEAVLMKDSYIMPFTKRVLQSRLPTIAAAANELEQQLLLEMLSYTPRKVSPLDMKDGASDFAVGMTNRNIYIPTQSIR